MIGTSEVLSLEESLEEIIIDAKAKDLAAKRLARFAERATANGAARPGAPVPERSPETAEQLRAQVRASLMRRRA